LLSPSLSHEALSASYKSGWEMGLFAHVLPAADPAIYFPSKSAQRRRVTYFPSLSTPMDKYPRIPWGPTWSIHQTRSPPSIIPGDTLWDAGSKGGLWWEKEERRRARAMRLAGICLFENWHQGLLDDNVAQAMLSGCVVAMVTPEVEAELVSPLIIALPRPSPLNSSIPVSLPVESVQTALQGLSTSDRKRKGLHGFILARQKFVPNVRLNAVLDTMSKYQEGARGYLFPHGFRWSCDSYTAEGRAPWCG